ncbi:protein phosphatase 1 regulatory subunit 14A isoform X2 [Anas platyrhynchos]|uniref:protein phosphatase 1 regulatory subunit 14A isoform X2 n=1 Tax=Anas platyrhynchos TaxID=8839 RepID=UPI0018D90F0F|nr:protein phosphatase 1 regulatory subunit 14A isoform X2 [Anas platyrhynchos]
MAASGSGRGGRGRSPGPRGAQARPRPPRLSPGPPPRRQARVTVRYDRRQLQRRLDTERWIDGRLGELYRGREAEMPDEVNIDDLLELPTDEERAQRLQGILKTCTADTQDFVRELLAQLRGLPKQRVLQGDPGPP